MAPDRWRGVSEAGQDFIRSLLELSPSKRLTAEQALQHHWFTASSCDVKNSEVAVQATQQFQQSSESRQCCLRALAWCLPSEDCSKVQRYFLSLANNQTGTIGLSELEAAMQGQLQGASKDEIQCAFDALDYNKHHEISWTDFLAALLLHEVDLSDNLLELAFSKLDKDGTGSITAMDLLRAFGPQVGDRDTKDLFTGLDRKRHGSICLTEFKACIRSVEPEIGHQDALCSRLSEGLQCLSPSKRISSVLNSTADCMRSVTPDADQCHRLGAQLVNRMECLSPSNYFGSSNSVKGSEVWQFISKECAQYFHA